MGIGIASTNEWPQIEDMVLMPGNHANLHHHHLRQSATPLPGVAAAAAAPTTATTTTTSRVIERPVNGGAGGVQAAESHHHHQALKCPRCDSSNTKFCYYNNYSLSQPRHFCKACKRYWTRGGTLRNVPVGGGCRKNKRVKKPSPSSSSSAASASEHPSLPPPIPTLSLPNGSQIDASCPSSSGINPMFYALPTTSSDLAFQSLRARLEQRGGGLPLPCTAYDLQPQLNALGLCFPMNTSTTATATATATATQQQDADDYPSGFKSHISQFQSPDGTAAANSGSSSLMHDYSLFSSSLSTSAAASLLAASLRQPKMGPSSTWSPYEDIQAAAAGGNLGLFKDIKEEEGNNNAMNHIGRLDWQVPCENPLENMAADTSLYWNSSIGAWPDAANCGTSSVTPLI